MLSLFKNIKQDIRKSKFLPTDSSPSKYFCEIDSKELLSQNLKTQPESWRYRNKKVTYTINSQKYRTIPFKDINWEESIVLFGCSTVFGVGLSDDETIDFYLNEILGVPVINMGVIGSSINYALHNSVILNQGYPTPKAVVQIWTLIDRCVYYFDNKLISYGAWNTNNDDYFYHWNKHSDNPHVNAIFAQMISRQLWQPKTKYYETTFFDKTATALNCDCLINIDKARDLLHPGYKSAKLMAELIAKNLKS
jgi:hypothetical protein